MFRIGELNFPYIKEYFTLTENLIGSITCLFIITTKPYKTASHETLGRWKKSTSNSAGINTSIFTPHSTRLAATSRAATRIPI